MKAVLSTMLVGVVASPALAQPPIIDMHLHALPAGFAGPEPTAQCVSPVTLPSSIHRETFAETWERRLAQPTCEDPVWAPRTDEAIMRETIEAMNKLNVFGVVSGAPELVSMYVEAAPERLYSGLWFELGIEERQPSVARLRELHSKGRLAVLGEIANQYQGILPADERMVPYWSLAEELDIPVAIHIGTGPPGAVYLGWNGYRAHLHSPLTLEEVLVQHPKLRVQIMHAGYPMLDDLLAILYAHPQVYVDTGVIVWSLPRAEFYRYLETIVNAGYSNRVMFGSDQMIWPGLIERSVAIIEEAPFLSEQQKRDLLYNNAARFLGLGDEKIRDHHRRQN
jgi:predicted TIM-barrel fold metal-dependent hydrolase